MQLSSRPVAASAPACASAGARAPQQRRRCTLQRPGRRGAAAVQASSTENKGLFTTNSSLLGPKAPTLGGPSLGPSTSSSAKPGLSLDDVPLESGLGVDYSQLKAYLKEGEWREAEDETRARLIEAAGAPGGGRAGDGGAGRGGAGGGGGHVMPRCLPTLEAIHHPAHCLPSYF